MPSASASALMTGRLGTRTPVVYALIACFDIPIWSANFVVEVLSLMASFRRSANSATFSIVTTPTLFNVLRAV